MHAQEYFLFASSIFKQIKQANFSLILERESVRCKDKKGRMKKKVEARGKMLLYISACETASTVAKKRSKFTG